MHYEQIKEIIKLAELTQQEFDSVRDYVSSIQDELEMTVKNGLLKLIKNETLRRLSNFN